MIIIFFRIINNYYKKNKKKIIKTNKEYISATKCILEPIVIIKKNNKN